MNELHCDKCNLNISKNSANSISPMSGSKRFYTCPFCQGPVFEITLVDDNFNKVKTNSSMKFGFIGLILVILFSIIGYKSFSFKSEETRRYEQLTSKGKESMKALKEILNESELTTTTNLYMASTTAIEQKMYSEAIFLFFAAMFRGEFDEEIYPPKGTGGDSPMVLFGALQFQIGSAIQPIIKNHPSHLNKALSLISDWSPKVPNNYSPGWEYIEKRDKEKALRIFKDNKRKFLNSNKKY